MIPALAADTPYDITTLVPKFNPMLLLHGEQFLAIRKHPVPTEGTFIAKPRLLDVADKGPGGAAIVYTGTSIVDKHSGEEVWYSESSVVLRGSGGFGGSKTARKTPG